MISLSFLRSHTILVLGFGKTGHSACVALAAGGATVLAWDDHPKGQDAIRAAGWTLTAPDTLDWSTVQGVLVSPGIPAEGARTHPLIRAASARGIPLLNDLDLLFQAHPEAIYVGITGTNGKSTTTALVGHILHTAGLPVQVGGNIGTPALALDPPKAGEIVVLEASSYQLALVRHIRFRAAALLNLTPDHLERHGTMADYLAAKMYIFSHQYSDDTAVIGLDTPPTRTVYATAPLAGRRIGIAVTGAVAGGVCCHNGWLVDDLDGQAVRCLDLATLPRLPGVHNHENIAASYALTRCLGVPQAAIAAAMASFPGLPHRMELIATQNGVRYVNDSKATNGDAAARALACYDRIYWIVGGEPKQGGLEGLAPLFGRVVRAYTIGNAADAFSAILSQAGVTVTPCGTLDRAVAAAHADAHATHTRQDSGSGAVLLLSPACASFDQFDNFEHRGEVFRALVTTVLAQVTF
jgi:UDP-N-acetylmuramoylalanine--D-glutamate ligase